MVEGAVSTDAARAVKHRVCSNKTVVPDHNRAPGFCKEPGFRGDKAIVANHNAFHLLQVFLPLFLPGLCPGAVMRFKSCVQPGHVTQTQFMLLTIFFQISIGFWLGMFFKSHAKATATGNEDAWDYTRVKGRKRMSARLWVIIVIR